MRLVITSFLITLSAPITTLAAQGSQDQLPLQRGDWVKVRFACTTPRVHGKPASEYCITLEGGLASVTTDTISVHPDGGPVPVALLLASVDGVERREEGRSYAGRGALYGALIGAAAGGVTLYLASRSSGFLEEGAGGFAVLGALLGGLAGAPLGAGIGALIRTDSWQEVQLDQLRVQPVVARDGRFGLMASVRF